MNLILVALLALNAGRQAVEISAVFEPEIHFRNTSTNTLINLPRRNRSRRSTPRTLTNVERSALLQAHNEWRAKAARGELNGNKTATAMNTLYWDSELERSSEKYASECIWEHSQNMGMQSLTYQYGENLYAVGPAFRGLANIRVAVDAWAVEHLDYNHDTNDCPMNAMCGHYTQVVWATTTRVGCAVHDCDTIRGLSWGGSILVCQYYQPGNYYGELPYEYGRRECEENVAYPGLCSNKNEICGKENRCFATEACTPTGDLSEEPTDYSCEKVETGCEFFEETGYEVRHPYDGYNGMTDENGYWKYCGGELEECQAWCVAQRDQGCKGLTTNWNNPGYYFPVLSVVSKDTFSQGRIWVLDCERTTTVTVGSTAENQTSTGAALSCENLGCSHACFQNSNDTFECACPKSMDLVGSSNECVNVTC